MRKLESHEFTNWHKVRNPLKILFNGFLMFLAKYFPSMSAKRFLLRLTGVKIGKNVVIAPSVIDPFFPELIVIADNSIIGWGAMLLTHEIVGNKFKKGSIKIGKNTTIGAHSVILPGINIGDNVVVEACSLVNKDVPSNNIVGGVPVKKIKTKFSSK